MRFELGNSECHFATTLHQFTAQLRMTTPHLSLWHLSAFNWVLDCTYSCIVILFKVTRISALMNESCCLLNWESVILPFCLMKSYRQPENAYGHYLGHHVTHSETSRATFESSWELKAAVRISKGFQSETAELKLTMKFDFICLGPNGDNVFQFKC